MIGENAAVDCGSCGARWDPYPYGDEDHPRLCCCNCQEEILTKSEVERAARLFGMFPAPHELGYNPASVAHRLKAKGFYIADVTAPGDRPDVPRPAGPTVGPAQPSAQENHR
jgi:hypothetical protein